MARGGSTERQVFHFFEIKAQKPVELTEGKMMHMRLLARKPFTSKDFPAPMQMSMKHFANASTQAVTAGSDEPPIGKIEAKNVTFLKIWS